MASGRGRSDTRSRRKRDSGDRVHIVYRPDKDSDPIELPLKILVMDDFGSAALEPSIADRQPVEVERKNFNEVMAKQGVAMQIEVADELADRVDGHSAGSFGVSWDVASLADLTPRRLMQLVPQLRAAESKRKSLLQAREIWNEIPAFREKWTKAWNDESSRRALLVTAGLDDGALPGESQIVVELQSIVVSAGFLSADFHRALAALVVTCDRQAVDGSGTVDASCYVELQLAELSARVRRQLNEILHNSRFQQIEAAWRSLELLVNNVDTRENIEIDLLSATKDELLADFEDAPELPHCGLYRIIYSAEYGTFGGKPYGLVCANYLFDPSPRDLALLRFCSNIAAVAHAPFVANANPEFFGETDFTRLPAMHLGHLFEGPRYRRWHSFRDTDDARYVGLCLPRFLLRTPYTEQTARIQGIAFREECKGARECLWGPSSIMFAARVAQAFAKYRWCVNVVGDGEATGCGELPLPDYPAIGELGIRIPVEVLISEKKEVELAEQGFIPLVGRRAKSDTCFVSANSVRSPKAFAETEGGKEAELNHRLGTQFPYLFIVTRLAHYIKVLQREPLGSVKDPAELERELNGWIRQYVADMETVSAAVRARKPLRQASITVEEVAGRGDWFRCKVSVRPHFRYMGAAFTLSIGSKLETG